MMDGHLHDSNGICGGYVTPKKNIPEKKWYVFLFASTVETMSRTYKQPFWVPYSQIPPVKMRWRFKTKFHTSRKLRKFIEIVCPTKSKEVKRKGNIFKTTETSSHNHLHSKPTLLPLVPNLIRISPKLFLQFLHQSGALWLRFWRVCLACPYSENWRHDIIGKEKGRTFWNGGTVSLDSHVPWPIFSTSYKSIKHIIRKLLVSEFEP